MTSPSERIAQVERELQKYTAKKSEAKTLASIGSNIGERIKILHQIHSEILAISKELYYYDMVDYLGNLRIDILTLSQCVSLCRELEKAKERFREDRDEKYLAFAEKLRRRLDWAGLIIAKKHLRNHNTNEDFIRFYRESSKVTAEKLKKEYFELRIKEIEKSIQACVTDIEKNYQTLILGEIIAFETVFSDSVTQSKELFEPYIFSVLKKIFTKKNQNIVKKIIFDMNRDEESQVERFFREAAKKFNAYIPKSCTDI